MSVTEAIKKRLEELNITQMELAQKLGTTRQNLNNKLSRDNFSSHELYDICIILGLEINLMSINGEGLSYKIEYGNEPAITNENSST